MYEVFFIANLSHFSRTESQVSIPRIIGPLVIQVGAFTLTVNNHGCVRMVSYPSYIVQGQASQMHITSA